MVPRFFYEKSNTRKYFYDLDKRGDKRVQVFDEFAGHISGLNFNGLMILDLFANGKSKLAIFQSRSLLFTSIIPFSPNSIHIKLLMSVFGMARKIFGRLHEKF